MGQNRASTARSVQPGCAQNVVLEAMGHLYRRQFGSVRALNPNGGIVLTNENHAGNVAVAGAHKGTALGLRGLDAVQERDNRVNLSVRVVTRFARENIFVRVTPANHVGKRPQQNFVGG